MRRGFAVMIPVFLCMTPAIRTAFAFADGWTGRGLEGSILALALAPSDPNVLYAGLHEHQGIFRSSDAGTTWTQVLEGCTVGSLAVHPANPDVVLAGVFCADRRNSKLLHSTDGGKTWRDAAIQSSRAGIPLSFHFNPAELDVVYAAAIDTILRSMDGGSTWDDAWTDLGNQLILSGCYDPEGCGLLVMAIDPQDPNVLYAGGTPSWGTWKSTNGGTAWKRIFSGTQLNDLVINPRDSAVLIAATETGILRSIDGGDHWSSADIHENTVCLILDSANPANVYAGLEDGAARSRDGGVTWTPMDLGLPPGDAVWALDIDSRTPSTLYAGTGHGVYSYTNKASLATLYFPCLATRDSGASDPSDDEYTGFSIVNLDSTDAELTLTAYRSDGSLVSGMGVANPAIRSLKAGAQLVATDVEIWGAGLAAASPAGWFKVESTAASVTGSFLRFNSTRSIVDGAAVSPGIVLTPECDFDLYCGAFTEIEPAGFTLIRVANPNPTVARLWFELYDQNGDRSRTSELLDLNSSCSFEESLPSLFPGYTPSAHDYVAVWSDSPVVLFETMEKTGQLVEGLYGWDASGGAGRLYSPQYVAGGPDWSTAISVVNFRSNAATAELRLIGDDGSQIGALRTVAIPAGGKAYIDDPNFFVPSGASPVQGYVEIKSLGPEPVPLMGSVTFGDPARIRFGTALSLTEGLLTDFVFGQMASNAEWFTGIALVNPNAAAVTATIQVHHKSGSVIGTSTSLIPAGQRICKLLTEYFPDLAGTDISSGYIRVVADKGVAAFALYGASNLSSLAASPPLIVP